MGVELPAVFGQGLYELGLEVVVDRQCLRVSQLLLNARVMEVMGDDSKGEL